MPASRVGGDCAIGKPPAFGTGCTGSCCAGCGTRIGSTGAGPASTDRPLRQKGGDATGPNPTDRGRPGTKRHLATDRQGIPLAVLLTGANVHDSVPFEALIDAIPAISEKRGRPRQRPDKLHADKVYDHRRCRDACRRRSIAPRIARRGIESAEKLGRYRWVIERSFAWLNKFRRLAIRYQRRADIHYALTSLGCSPICLRALEGRF